MSNFILTPPYQPFTLDKLFKGVFNGYIYAGVVNATAGQVITNQIQAYVEAQDGTLTEIPQPIRTNGGGFPVYNGEVVKVVFKSAFSLLVQDKNQNQIWYQPNMSFFDPQTAIAENGLPWASGSESIKDQIYIYEGLSVYDPVGGNPMSDTPFDSNLFFRVKGDELAVRYEWFNESSLCEQYCQKWGLTKITFTDKKTYTLTEQMIWTVSGLDIQVSDEVTFDCNSTAIAGLLLTGSAGSEQALTVAMTRGDKTFTIASETEFNAGDYVHFVSVKNALNRQDAAEYFLGDGTEGLSYAYFSEFNQVVANLGGGKYQLANETIFPGYNVDASGESETQRATSGVKKVNFIENTNFTGGIWIKDSQDGNLLQDNWAKDCSIQATTKRGSTFGASVLHNNSLNCDSYKHKDYNDPTLVWDYATYHGRLNRFINVGTQNCGFTKPFSSFAAQAVDYSYTANTPNVNIRPYCIGGYFDSCFEGLTSHAGSYQEQWLDNVGVRMGKGGISIRGYEPTVKRNSFEGLNEWTNADNLPGAEYTYGISFSYGACRRADVSGNSIKGYFASHAVISSSTLAWDWEEVLLDITNEEVSKCYQGLYTQFSSTPNNNTRFINYSNNRFSAMGRYVANLSEYSAGICIDNNVLMGRFRYNGSSSFVSFVNAGANCPQLQVTNNKWIAPPFQSPTKTEYMVSTGSITDDSTYPESQWGSLSVIHSNETDENVTYNLSLTGYNQYKYMDEIEQKAVLSDQGVVLIGFNKSGVTPIILDQTSGEATQNLTTIQPFTNAPIKKGSSIMIRITTGSRGVTLVDKTSSGVSKYGIDTPNDANIELSSINNTVMLTFSGTNWIVSNMELTV